MRLTAYLMLVTGLHLSARGLSQTISLDLKNEPLEKAMSIITAQSGFHFVYTNVLVKEAKPVSLSVSGQQLKAVLDKLFSNQRITYAINDQQRLIILSEKPPPATRADVQEIPPPHDVKGRVLDEKGVPLASVSVSVKGSQRGTVTNEHGEFQLSAVNNEDVLVVSYVGYLTLEMRVADKTDITIRLTPNASSLAGVEVPLSTGYQTIPKERATGSFDQVNHELVNRSVTTNILDRLDGIANGVQFNTAAAQTGIVTGISNNKLGITIRGMSTLSPSLVGGDPLIVVDNFPYEGDMRNINPNDVESITILKDAAAASIWGARAGNGVIVITTKKGRLNVPMTVEFNSSLTVANKPNVNYDKDFLNSSAFIDAETYLFNKGYFDADLTDQSSWPVVSPVVELLAAERSGLSAASATAQINALRNLDVRQDISKYIYQKAIDQQYSLGIRGGGRQLAYTLSVGYDDNRNNLVRNGQQRLTINSNNTYTPFKNFQLTACVNYSRTNVGMNNQLPYGAIVSGGKYGLIPYSRLADAGGHPLAIVKDYRGSFIDSLQQIGFLDQHYSPLNDIANADYTGQITDLLLKTSASYRFAGHFNAQLTFQNDRQLTTTSNYQSEQTYYASNLINQFTQYNSAAKSFTYPVPLGGILTLQDYVLNSRNLRAQLNYNETFGGKHAVTALAGAEANESVSTGITPLYYGYNDQYGTSVTSMDFRDPYSTDNGGYMMIPPPNGNVAVETYRYISYFANAAYTYNDLYTLTVSGRKDGANIFGAKTNDKVTPLWSAGLGWNLSREKFYSVAWMPYLRLRASYGFNGNVYNGSAYSTGLYFTNSMTGAQYILGLTPPNPDLRWEKVRNINFGIDFAAKGNVVHGTIEPFQKAGSDLIEPVALGSSTGFQSYNGNAASTRTDGIDVTLTSENVNRAFKWSTTLLFTHLHDVVTRYDVHPAATDIQYNVYLPAVGRSIESIFSYRWAGIDQTNGDPQGYLNGKISKDYTGIINNFQRDSLQYNGSATPTTYGFLRNDFSYKQFTLSINIGYEFGFWFRRPSVSLNYSDILEYPNNDFSRSWQKPGDQTDVPAIVYPSNFSRNTFYRYSAALVTRGDNIRLHDIRLSYDVGKNLWHKMPFSMLQLYSYASNLPILWRANKYGIDPDAVPPIFGGHALPIPFTLAFGLKANF
ncbi:MAG TPA: SusC/RagA family TonB-linked outer membrane protein [Puia sp.]|nr:SusC/RagA family TonB-linked outer membrane protein [Puia sp.]